jgi:hypothetical protein
MARKTLQSELYGPFERIQRREVFESPLASKLKDRIDEAMLNAAIAKCVDLNVLINSRKVAKRNAFLYVANLRGVAEDLIYLQFLQKMGARPRRQLLRHIQRFHLHSGLLTQVRFFSANNPFQPVAGGSANELEDLRVADRDALRAFWKAQGETRRDGPSIKDMADRTGLTQTYEYIYFLSSNFVHFNPHTLLRMGWGPEQGPFRFSVHNFSSYYIDLASFYAAVIFIGFYYRLGTGLFSRETAVDVEEVLKAIDDVPRWPELVTFEEMNREPPMPYFLSHAMRKVTENDEESVPYGAILREVRGV